ncbi:phage tail tube protein [Rhodococcus sp. IEGM 1351]|uniref:phage tail tube protein n=1 Tax=Rhodococcus sp. IEGM 1351 TaxID=3047089 RepID=UPI0024B7D62C|nr:phage tail tube protein [Rhodococcus sp. IEGM 1351]MDI9934684.1 phage tail tube protein [Rhodococcus sp. IEGM 1351]
MTAFDPYIGRREAVGFGIGSDPTATVAPQIFMRWLDQDIQPKTEIIENDSAMGVVEKINDSEVVGKWVEGTIGGKVTDIAVGFPLLGWFGSVSTGAAVSGVYPHTFEVSQSSIPPAMTLAKVTPAKSERYSYLTFDTLELTAEKQGWVQISSAVKARIGTSSSETVAFSTEKEFTSKNIVLKTAANIAGLAAASPIDALSLKLNLERSSESFFPLGGDDNPKFDRGTVEAKGEFVIRYANTDVEDDYLAHAIKAMSITLTNGTSSLAFTAGKVRFTELEKSSDKDEIITQTISFSCQLDATTSKTISALLKNTRATYAAA